MCNIFKKIRLGVLLVLCLLVIGKILIFSKSANIETLNLRKIMRSYCHTKWWGSKDFGLNMLEHDIIRKMLPNNSVVYVLGGSEDVTFEIELSSITGATIHIFYLRNASFFYLGKESRLDYSQGKSRPAQTRIIYHKINETKPNNTMYSIDAIPAFISGESGQKISYLNLRDSMQKLHHYNIDLLKINTQYFSLQHLKKMFESKIFPRLIILPFGTLEQASSENNWISSALSTYGYDLVSGSSRSQFCTFILNGCSHSELLQRAKQISLRSGFVNLQFFNQGYLNMTKSWICNVRSLPSVLPATLFIAGDLLSYTSLLELDNVNVILENVKRPANMRYGEREYFSFIHYRTIVILKLLKNNISVWITESDAYWKASPFDEMDPSVDMYIVNNNVNHKEVSGGIIFLKACELIVDLWEKLILWQVKHPHEDEQPFLTELVYKTKASVHWLPTLEYVSGLWYTSEELQTGKEKVILNNFIIGNRPKENRAKIYGQWFLNINGSCKSPIQHY